MTSEISLAKDLIYMKARHNRCMFWNRTCLSLFVANRPSLKLQTVFFKIRASKLGVVVSTGVGLKWTLTVFFESVRGRWKCLLRENQEQNYATI